MNQDLETARKVLLRAKGSLNGSEPLWDVVSAIEHVIKAVEAIEAESGQPQLQ